jgi:hypothetical protein
MRLAVHTDHGTGWRSPTGTPGLATESTDGRVFRREGEYWTIAYDGAVFRLRDGKGLRYLAHLLQHPGERFPAAGMLTREAPAAAESNTAERARSAVTKRIKAAIKKITQHNPVLGYHLNRVIKTGRECAYVPDPGRPETWSL